MKRILKGPGGWTLELDSDEIFPEDPGQGTPAMVYSEDRNCSGTYWCVCETGEIDCQYPVPSRVMKWLNSEQVESIVEEFMKGCKPLSAMELGNQHGYRCPECHTGDCLAVEATSIFELLHDGSEQVGHVEWEPESSAQCDNCGWHGMVKDLNEEDIADD